MAFAPQCRPIGHVKLSDIDLQKGEEGQEEGAASAAGS